MGFGDFDDAIDVADIWQVQTVAVPIQLDLEIVAGPVQLELAHAAVEA